MRWLLAAVLLGTGYGYTAPLKVTLQAGPRLAGSRLTYSGTTTVTARRGQQVVWQKKIFSPPYNAKDPTTWSVAGSVVWLTVMRGEVSSHADSIGLRLSDGKKLWDIDGVYTPLYLSQKFIVYKWNDVTTAWPDLHPQEVIVIDTQSGKPKRLHFTLKERLYCEGMNERSYEGGAVRTFRADAQFFYATVTDACGVFTSRFDWHGSAQQQPTVFGHPSVQLPH